jgi:hypothetical protein
MRSRIESAFRFLEDEYGFRLYRVARFRGDGVELRYRNATTGVAVEADAGGSTSVVVGRLDRVGRMRTAERDDHGFWWWVLDDVVGHDLDAAAPPEEQAALLRERGGPVLRGDFASLSDMPSRRIPELADA